MTGNSQFPPGYKDFSLNTQRPKEISLKEDGLFSQVTGFFSSAGEYLLGKAAQTRPGIQFLAGRLKTDPKVLQQSQAALEKLGFVGAKSPELKKMIDDAAAKIVQKNPSLEKLISSSTEEVATIKVAIETVMSTAIANLAKLVQAKKASSGIPYAPQSFNELMQDILEYFVQAEEQRFLGHGMTCTMHEQIAKIESSKLKDATKKKRLAEVFTPLTNDMVKAAFQNDFSKAGLGPIASFLGNTFAEGAISKALADYYTESFESNVVSDKEKAELAKSDEGQLLIDTVEFGVKQILQTHPLLKSLGSFAGPLISSLVTRLCYNLSGGNKTNPLQTALKTLNGILVDFYLTQGATLKNLYLLQMQSKEELDKITGSVTPHDPVQIAARTAHVTRLNEIIKKCETDRVQLFVPFTKQIWVTLGLDNEKLVKKFFDDKGKQKLLDETIPSALCKACDKAISENSGLLRWIAPDSAAMDKEIAALGLGSSVEPLAQGFSQLLLAPAPGVLSNMSGQIADELIKLINGTLPLGTGIKEHLKKAMVDKLQTLAMNPKDTDPLWQFIQNNIKGLALDIVKSIAGNPLQADLIRALSALPSGGSMQTVVDLLRRIVGNFKGVLQQFQKDHGAQIATAFAGLSNPPTKEEMQKYHALFTPLCQELLAQTGLDKLLTKEARLGIFGLDNEIRKQLLIVSADLYKQMTQPAQQNPAPPAVATPAAAVANPKEHVELLSHVVTIIGKHFNGNGDPLHPTRSLAERIAAIEASSNDDVTKKREIANLFQPLVEELNKDKKLIDFITPLLQSLINSNASAPFQAMIGTAIGALGKEFMPMLPSMLAHLYPLLAGSSGDASIRKDLLNQSDEGKIILAVIDLRSKKLIAPLLNGLLKKLANDDSLDFTNDPLLKHLEGFGSYLADSILSSFFLNLAGHDTDNPLKSIIVNVQNLIGNLYQDNLIPLKALYKQQIEIKQSLKTCSSSNNAEITRLNALLEESQKAKFELMKPIVNALWEAGEFENCPPFNLIPDIALDLISGELCEAFDKLIESQPGILSWIDPDQSNTETRKELALVENSEICTSLAGIAGPLAIAPVKELIVNPTNTDNIATAAVTEITTALPLSDDLKACLKTVLSTLLQDLAQQNPLWGFVQSNIEGLVLDLFNSMSIKQASLGRAIFRLAAGSNVKDGYNPLEELAGELLEQAHQFKTKHGAAVETNYAKDLAAIRKARADLANARAAMPAQPSQADKEIIDTQKNALESMETAFYDRFQPLAEGLISSIGFDKLLEKDSRLGIFGLDKLIRKQLLVLCADVYHQAINPLNEQTNINHHLGIALYDPNYAAKMAQGNSEKAEKLRKAGIKLDGADLARQKTILDASGTTTTAEVAEGLSGMLASIIERETQKYLMEAGDEIVTELNTEVLQGKLTDPTALQLLSHGIQNLSKATKDGGKGFFKYLHAILVPALTKALNNVINSTVETMPSLPGEHGKQALPSNIILRLFEIMHKDITDIEIADPTLQAQRECIWKQEDCIQQQKIEIDKANAANKLGAKIDVQAMDAKLQAMQKDLNALFSKFGNFFQPLVKKLLKIASAESKNITDSAHPLHDATILPTKTRNALWEVVVPNCLGIYIGSHYHKMKPRTEALEEQLRDLVGSNKLNEFCYYMGIAVRDSTPDSLTKEPDVLASDLTGTILDTFKKFEQTAPEYIKKMHATLNTHQDGLKHFLKCFFQSVGSSKLEIFTTKLWPALQKYSYPVILQMVYKVVQKLSQHDSTPIRTKLAIDFMKLLNAHAKTANSATGTKYSHPHEVPIGSMLDQFKKAGQLHPVMNSVISSSPEQEAAIRKQYFTDYAKEFFATIGFTKDDLPLDEAEKEGAFKLFVEELAPLTIGITFDSLAPGKTRNTVEGDLYNACIKIMLERYQKRSAEAQEKAKASGDKSLRESLPEISALLAKQSKVVKQDADQDKLDEELGNLLVNELRNRIPDAIAHERLLIRPLLEASAKDLGAIIREEWCEKGSLVGLLAWLGTNTLEALFKGKYSESLDKFVPEQTHPDFHPVSPTPEKVTKTAKEAHSLGTRVASDLIMGSLEEWFNGVLENIARTFNAALVDLYQLIDKIVKTKKYSDAIIKGIKNAVWYIGWGLFYATVIPWVISLIAKHAFLPLRVGVNVKNIQNELHAAYNRNFFYHAADRFLDRPFKPAGTQAAAAPAA